jgi:hypothetical protein
MPEVTNPFQTALDALKNGQDIETAVYGSSQGESSDGVGNTPTDRPATEFDTEAFMAGSDGEVEVKDDDSEQDGEEGTTQSKAEAQKAQPTPDVEEVVFTDETGKKKVKVDWNDRTKLKKYIEMAAGMRKFQADRDREVQWRKQVEPEYTDLKASWSAVTNAVQEDGIRGLVNLLYKDPSAYDKFIAAETEKTEAKRNASPSEKLRIDLEEKLANETRQRERLAKQVQDNLTTAEKAKADAAENSLKSQITPAFERYRFAGKLGDPNVEQVYDQAVWSQAMDQLIALPKEVELTREIIDRTFQSVSNTFRKAVKEQAQQQAKKVVDSKKRAAQETVAASAMSGYKQQSSAAHDEFRGDIRSGNLSGALQSLFSGKFKL